MKTNGDLQQDVQDAIKWELLLNSAEIGVTVKDGIVTLTGSVDNFAKKSEAEDAAKNVAGVKAVVEKLEITDTETDSTTDEQIAAEVLSAHRWNWQIPNGKIKIKVEAGWVTLEGDLNWDYQRQAAKTAIKNLKGIKGVTNRIKIKSEIENEIEKDEIKKAFDRNWSINAEAITVTVDGTTVTLSGTVTSSYQKEEAGKIAYKAPGVWLVNNDIVVEYNHSMAQ